MTKYLLIHNKKTVPDKTPRPNTYHVPPVTTFLSGPVWDDTGGLSYEAPLTPSVFRDATTVPSLSIQTIYGVVKLRTYMLKDGYTIL